MYVWLSMASICRRRSMARRMDTDATDVMVSMAIVDIRSMAAIMAITRTDTEATAVMATIRMAMARMLTATMVTQRMTQ